MENIQQPNLDVKKTAGIVGNVEYHNGESSIIATKSADVTNSGADLNGVASSENLSAKFKTPRVKQQVPAAGENQYQ